MKRIDRCVIRMSPLDLKGLYASGCPWKTFQIKAGGTPIGFQKDYWRLSREGLFENLWVTVGVNFTDRFYRL